MKVVSNGYTRIKINGVYATNIPELTRIILSGFTYLLEKANIATGEPSIIGEDKLYGFFTSYSTLFYNEKNDKIVVYFNRGLWDHQQNKNKTYITKTYDNINDELINDLKKCVREKNINYSLDTYIQRIELYKEYKEDWNSYRCNEVSLISIESAQNFITKLHPLLNLADISLNVYPIADGGNIAKSPPEDSKSTIGITVKNGSRELEFEIDKNGNVSPFCIENVYDEQYNSSLIFPNFGQDDEYVILDVLSDEYLKQALLWIHYEELVA